MATNYSERCTQNCIASVRPSLFRMFTITYDRPSSFNAFECLTGWRALKYNLHPTANAWDLVSRLLPEWQSLEEKKPEKTAEELPPKKIVKPKGRRVNRSQRSISTERENPPKQTRPKKEAILFAESSPGHLEFCENTVSALNHFTFRGVLPGKLLLNFSNCTKCKSCLKLNVRSYSSIRLPFLPFQLGKSSEARHRQCWRIQSTFLYVPFW